MAKLGEGIRENTLQVLISGARVAFDLRSTEEVEKSRSPKNFKAAEEPMRKRLWEERVREEQRQHQAAE